MDRVFAVGIHDRPANGPDVPSETTKFLRDFLLQFRVGGEFIYRYVGNASDCIPNINNARQGWTTRQLAIKTALPRS